MEEVFTETTKLLDKISDEIMELNFPEGGNASAIWKWQNEFISNKEYLEILLPLCKLLNQAFFEHGPLDRLKSKPAE